jgi:hypothetical protein
MRIEMEKVLNHYHLLVMNKVVQNSIPLMMMNVFLVDFDDFQIDQVMSELMLVFHHLYFHHPVDTKVIVH